MALSSQAMFMLLRIQLLFSHKTHILSSLFPICNVKNLVCFYKPQFGPIAFNISLSDPVLRLIKKFRQKCYVQPAELFKFVNYFRL